MPDSEKLILRNPVDIANAYGMSMEEATKLAVNLIRADGQLYLDNSQRDCLEDEDSED